MAHAFAREHSEGRRMYANTDWSAAVWSGIIAGAVFMMMQMLLVMMVQGQSPWAPPRMIAAMVLGQDVLPPPADFELKIMMTAIMIRFPLSIMLGLFTGWVVHRMTTPRAVIAGGAIGLAVYVVNFYLVAPAVFPWFAQAQGWVSAMNHIIFGMVLGGTYAALRNPSEVSE